MSSQAFWNLVIAVPAVLVGAAFLLGKALNLPPPSPRVGLAIQILFVGVFGFKGLQELFMAPRNVVGGAGWMLFSLYLAIVTYRRYRLGKKEVKS